MTEILFTDDISAADIALCEAEVIVLEDRAMYSALQVFSAMPPWETGLDFMCFSDVTKDCKRLKLIAGRHDGVKGPIPPFVLGYAIGRTWVAEL